MTEDRGVFFNRQHYIAKFKVVRAVKQSEVDELKDEQRECDHSVGDVCDHAQTEIDLVSVRRLQTLKEDITRIDMVLARLHNGWDGTCIDCAEKGLTTSVVPRLDHGIPTCRCSSCREARETKARRHGAPLGLVLSY